MTPWPFRKKGPDQLSSQLREQLLSKFGVNQEAADSMRYVTKRTKLSGHPVNLVCIFDPATVPDAELAASTYDSVMDRKESVLFTGQVFSVSYTAKSEKVVRLTDLRPS